MTPIDNDRVFEYVESGVDPANADRVSFDFERGTISTTSFEDGGVVQHETQSFQEAAKRVKIGRNQSCPCGSGKKYKKCHGF